MTQPRIRLVHEIRLRPISLLYCSILLIQTACLAQSDQTAKWKVFPLGDPPLTIKLPTEVTPMESSVPADLINRLQRFDTYRLYHAEGKVVAVFKFAQFNAPIVEASSVLLETEISNLMKSIKAEQVVRVDKEIKLNKIPALKSTGSFMLNNQKWIFQDMLIRKDSSMWQVWIAAEDSNPVYAKTMTQVVKSIKF